MQKPSSERVGACIQGVFEKTGWIKKGVLPGKIQRFQIARVHSARKRFLFLLKRNYIFSKLGCCVRVEKYINSDSL